MKQEQIYYVERGVRKFCTSYVDDKNVAHFKSDLCCTFELSDGDYYIHRQRDEQSQWRSNM